MASPSPGPYRLLATPPPAARTALPLGVSVTARHRCYERALGSRPQIALGRRPSHEKLRILESRAPISQDYGEFILGVLAEDWIGTKGISKQGTWQVP